MADGTVSYDVPAGAAARSRVQPDGLGARVALVPVMVGDDGTLLDLARPEHDGVVVEAFGSGNMPPGAVPARPALARRGEAGGAGHPLPLRARSRRSTRSTAGGARTVAMGAIPAGPRTPSQARMELTLALSAGVPYGAR